ncbi:hypothetical protein ZIOFF_071395 [Zingiber officinale]|uniref:Uncharacterized protein n=1 Tax=Zingiber officinale TaxID=94328 RepID=A0A8J5C1A1_ZINOF|nr:hypothetical protein ZIOFF_071395 [Zingiber officinale]
MGKQSSEFLYKFANGCHLIFGDVLAQSWVCLVTPLWLKAPDQVLDGPNGIFCSDVWCLMKCVYPGVVLFSSSLWVLCGCNLGSCSDYQLDVNARLLSSLGWCSSLGFATEADADASGSTSTEDQASYASTSFAAPFLDAQPTG